MTITEYANRQIDNMPSADYHKHPAMSRSALMELDRTPRHYWYKYLSGEAESEESDALRFGSAFHTLVLEPALFDAACIVVPPDAPKKPTIAQRRAVKCSDAGKQSIAWWDDFYAKAGARAIVEEDEIKGIKAMAAAILAEPASGKIINADGKVEQSFFWYDDTFRVEVKCRPDYYRDDGIILDLKTCADASEYEFQRSAVNYGYDLQAYMQIEGIERVTGKRPADYVFMCVEKAPPYCVAFYSATPEFIACGEARYNKLMAVYAACIKANLWPGYGPMVKPINPPSWWVKKLTEQGA